MPKIAYQNIRISNDRLELIQTCNQIIDEYQADGLMLTLRQLYYQLVSRDVIPNTIQSYKRVGDVVNDARLTGLMDWNAIEDRTRNLNQLAHWDSPSDILEACASQFRVDRWEDQPTYVEVWVEKEALAGVFERAVRPLDVPLFCCRGYTSQSEMWGAAQRFVTKLRQGKKVVILHFGDHDPSGIDMTRDIRDRLVMFAGHHESARASALLKVERLALNMDQVRKYNPPENPAKMTDSRFASYEAQFGDKSWELDALNPKTLNGIVREHVMRHVVPSVFDASRNEEAKSRGILQTLAGHWDDVEEKINEDWSEELSYNTQAARERLEATDGDGDDE